MSDLLEQQFIAAIEQSKKSIFRICNTYAEPPIEAQDLFQEVVFQVWKSYSSFQNKSNIRTWIYKIALNVCYSSKRTFERKQVKTTRLDSIQFVPGNNDPGDITAARFNALQECIATLKDVDRSMMILFLEDLPYKEIANILGLTENHVAVKMKRIRKLLFDCITPKLLWNARTRIERFMEKFS